MARKYRLALVVSAVLMNFIFLILVRQHRKASQAEIPVTLQSGHWVMIRACALLGVPVFLDDVTRTLPQQRDGHSVAQLKRAFETIGLDVTAEEKPLHVVLNGVGVRILHIAYPDHFIVMSQSSRSDVIVFDGVGRRRRLSIKEVEKRYSGICLSLRKPVGIALPIQKYPRIVSGPCMQMETLYIDKGDIPSDVTQVVYEFPIRNIGDQEVRVLSAAGDCSCLNIEYPESILPQQTAVLRATFTNGGTSGPSEFEHEIVISTNDNVLPVISVVAAGNTDTFFFASPDKVQFGSRLTGRSHFARVFVTYKGEDDSVLDSPLVSCTFPETTVRIRTKEQFEAESPLLPGLSRSRDLSGKGAHTRYHLDTDSRVSVGERGDLG